MTTVLDTPTGNRSALRALDVFAAFEAARRPLSLSELARATAMPVSTCHGVIKALQQAGYLAFLGPREVYPTRRLWDLAAAIRAHDPVLGRLEGALEALRDACDETVILGAPQAEAVQYLLVIESTQSIRYSATVGALKPLHSSAIGKALLGTLPAAERAAWLAEHPLPAITEHTLTDRAALAADLAAGAARGWWQTQGENVADVMAVAAPLELGPRRLGVAVAGPLHRMREHGEAHAARLLDTLAALAASASSRP
ncbi:MAG: helix-turn-helix domain-containing protein [Gammaproteobacteria bacterium]|nr:helix-turn-helix domain-containing protein [Gammaproteobacteria bacterium]MCP5199508.1 helix-turn-helix domain-containing protein [Gammaproteobacteria bacterium]